MSDETRTKSTIYVTGLETTQTTTEALHSFFIPFGDIVDVTLPLDRGQVPRGFGYVEFSSPEDAAAAIDNTDQAELFGKVLKVSPAKNLPGAGGAGAGGGGKTEGLGSKVAVWEQEGWLKKHEVDEEDRKAVESAAAAGSGAGAGGAVGGPVDPMEGLEGLDVAGPRPKR